MMYGRQGGRILCEFQGFNSIGIFGFSHNASFINMVAEFHACLPVTGVTMLRSVKYLRIHRERILRIAMTPKAVAHSHGHMLVYPRHCLDFPMAGLTENSRIHVGPVVEINVVRKRMNSHPSQRLIGIVYCRKFHDFRSIGFRYLVAVHAFLYRRYPGLSGFENSRMAIGARNAQCSGVKLMGKSYRLHRLIAEGETVRLREPADPGDSPQYRDQGYGQYKSRIK